jgi:hypothetical protein
MFHDEVTVECDECDTQVWVVQHREGYALRCQCPGFSSTVDVSEPMNNTPMTHPIAGKWTTIDPD